MKFNHDYKGTFGLLQPATVLTGLLLVVSSSTFAQDFKGVVFFGTSLSDPGNHFIEFGTTALQPFAPVPDSSYAIGGHHFSNGATWAEQVASGLHMPTSGGAALRAHGVFTNYAFGRARARQCGAVPAACPSGQYPVGVVDLGFEVGHFLSDVGGKAPESNLYVMEIGANDITDALGAFQTDPTGATSFAIIGAAVTAEAQSLQALYVAGGRTFLVLNTPNFALTPLFRSLGPAAQFAATQLALAYDGAMGQVLAALGALPGIRFIPVDLNAVLAQVETQPAAFGIANAVDACLTFGVTGNAVCSTPNRYLFWDGVHPTTAGHSLLAARVLQALGH